MPAPPSDGSTAPQAMAHADRGQLLLLSVLWGGSFLFVALAVAELPALTVVWLRVSLAALVLGAVTAVRRLSWPPRRAWAALAVMGVLNNLVPFALFATAQAEIDAGQAAILNATTPLFAVVVAALARAERMTLARLAGTCAGMAGVWVMMRGGGGGTLAAQGMCLMAALSYALAGVWGRRFGGMGLTPMATAFGMLTASAVMLMPLVAVIDRPSALASPGAAAAGAVLALAVLSTAGAYLLYFRILAGAGAVNLLSVTFLIPVSAVAMGAAMLGEVPGWHHAAGMALIGAGLWAVTGRRRA
ncbi:MAG: DMT family transporter [Gemmobacter sp.]